MKRLITGLSIALIFLIQTVTAVPLLETVAANAQTQNQEVLATDDQRVDDPRAEKLPADLISVVDSNRASDQLQDVIVQTTEPPAKSQRDLIRHHGGRIKYRFENINALLVELPVSAVQELAAEPSIAFITPDRTVNGSMDTATRLLGFDKLRQTAVSSYGNTYSKVDGTGVGVAILDSGVNSMTKDFNDSAQSATRIVTFADFTKSPAAFDEGDYSYDDYGHGTNVAGVACGNGWGSKQTDSAGVEWYPGNYGDFTGAAPQLQHHLCQGARRTGLQPGQ